MNKKPQNPLAFPFQSRDATEKLDAPNDGMTLRDYFASKALQSIILKADPGKYGHKDYNGQLFAKWSYEFADAMLKERELSTENL